MQPIDDQLGHLLQEAITDALHAAISDAKGWLALQPAGWAREGALQRLDKVRNNLLTRLVKEHIDRALSEWNPLPEELRDNRAAQQAWERVVGRKPTRVTDVRQEWEKNVPAAQLLLVVSVRVEAPAMWLRDGGSLASDFPSAEYEDEDYVEGEDYWPKEQRQVRVEVPVDAMVLEMEP
jgi:hypothetical protein